MATLSPYALKKMGFKRIDANEPISAKFWLIHIGHVEGLTISDEEIADHDAIDDLGVACRVAIGSSLNAISQEMLADDFSDEEEVWRKDHSTQPPFIAIYIGPTELVDARDGWAKTVEFEHIVTYDSFGSVMSKLKGLQEIAVPRIKAALTIRCADQNHPVKFLPVETMIFGQTPSGEVVHDYRISVSGNVTVSSHIKSDDLNHLIASALESFGSLDARVSTFLYGGEIEGDSVRRFLNYFVALEIFTHRAFKNTEPSSTDILAKELPESIREQGKALLRGQYKEIRSLGDRFVWCAITVWNHVKDKHVLEFKRLKKIRDDVAHGNISDIAATEVRAVRALTLHVIGGTSGSNEGVTSDEIEA